MQEIILESLGYSMRENLKKIIDKIWDIASQGARMMENECSEVMYNRKSKEHFEELFESLYTYIASEYMQCPDEPLDRHKVAAITMISIIKADVVTGDQKGDGNIFFGNYTLATDSGLQYMLTELNKRLIEKEMGQVEGYCFPVAMACETDYYRIFYRNLYFANNNERWNLNPLDIAERLFLLEYMTLEKNGINPEALKEY